MQSRVFYSLLAASVILAISGGRMAQSGEVLDRVMETGVLRIPNEPGWEPYSFVDESGTYTGFDVDVANEIARRIGVRLAVVDNADGSVITWEDQTSGQWNGLYDAVIGEMTPTAERDKYLDFPAVYAYGLGALAVHRDNASINTPADASGKRIGVLKAANYEYYIRRQPFGIDGMEPPAYPIDDPIVVTYDTESGPFEALAKGDGVELDGFINYTPVIMDLIKNGQPFKLVGKPLYRVPQAVAILPGDLEFADLLAIIVEEMRQDGTLRKLSLKWFEFDMTEK